MNPRLLHRLDQREPVTGAEAPMAESAPAKALRRLIAGYQTTFLVKVAAELKLADLLADGPRSVDELARATGSKPGPLRRVLFALGQIDVLLRTADGRLRLTPLGACLRSDHPDGLAAFARYQGDAIIQRPWANLLHSVRTGETAFDAIFGASLFEYLAAHPDAAALFTAGMGARTAEYLQAIVAACDWSGFNAIVDVGGADGTLLSSILATAANARGVIFDRPRVQAAAEQRIAADGLSGRCAFAGGDFLAAVPPGGDAYLLKYILHDWDDTAVVTILRNVHRAAPAHVRLLVIEPLLPDGDEPAQETAMMDVAMLAITGGRERTAAEFAALYERAGFRLSRTIPTASPFSLVEGVPA